MFMITINNRGYQETLFNDVGVKLIKNILFVQITNTQGFKNPIPQFNNFDEINYLLINVNKK